MQRKLLRQFAGRLSPKAEVASWKTRKWRHHNRILRQRETELHQAEIRDACSRDADTSFLQGIKIEQVVICNESWWVSVVSKCHKGCTFLRHCTCSSANNENWTATSSSAFNGFFVHSTLISFLVVKFWGRVVVLTTTWFRCSPRTRRRCGACTLTSLRCTSICESCSTGQGTSPFRAAVETQKGDALRSEQQRRRRTSHHRLIIDVISLGMSHKSCKFSFAKVHHITGGRFASANLHGFCKATACVLFCRPPEKALTKNLLFPDCNWQSYLV